MTTTHLSAFCLQAQLPHVKVHAYFAPVTPPTAVGGSGQRLCRCCVILWRRLPASKAQWGVPSSREAPGLPAPPSPRSLGSPFRHLQVKDFGRGCSDSGDSSHLHSAAIQSNQSLVSASTWQEWSQHSLDHAGDLDLLRGGCLLRYQRPAVGFVSAP